ncbi:secretory phospholipase A2 receptor-like isoform X2 [Mizuhopecten yessoensis]|uniref:secretory phospholipase A2 receptor-like isoform X2 n=1 Tax=Mizuhopecten yessoensis TaxID=6573 RepID=UPI000B45C93E|nr:secretory phospholipase A2 receptor-like isoform X2 [Mizuhopecten yessoensis]
MLKTVAVHVLLLVLGIVTVNSSLVDDLVDCPSPLPRTQFVKSYNDVCLNLITAKYSWNGANSNCQRHEGRLVQIQNQDKQEFIYNTLKSMHWEDWGVWIGATDHDTEGTWKWTDGTTLSYGNWHPGEGPTHGFLFSKAGYEDCALLRLNDNGRWHDLDCGTILYHHTSICEYQKVYRPSVLTTTTTPYTTPTTTTMLTTTTVNSSLVDDLEDCPLPLPRTQYVKSYNDVCLFLITGKYSWNGANSKCRRHGGRLVQIQDQDKQDFLYNTLKSMHWGDWGVWIGATDHDSEGTWKWTDGTKLSYGNWHPGEGPDHRFLSAKAGYEDCALLRLNDNGRWHDLDCGTILYHHTSICEYQKVYRPSVLTTTTMPYTTPTTTTMLTTIPTTMPTTTSAMTTIPTTTMLTTTTTTMPTTTTDNCSSYNSLASLVKFYGNNCIRFVKDAKSWSDANAECVSQGGHLLQIHSQIEQDFIFESLRSLHWSDSGAWIGATDHGSEGQWKWSDDSPVEYSHWKPGEGPFHNATNENCAMINVDDGMWYDYDCGAVIYNQAYICQYSQ